MGLKEMFDACPDSASIHRGFGMDWSMKGIGFGQLYFYVNEQDEIICQSECMGPESVKKILNILVDEAKFEDFQGLPGRELTKEKIKELRDAERNSSGKD